MKDQPHRLPAGIRHFAGAAITRSRPIRFKLNGQVIPAFEGDTVLSAVLANGFDTLGLRAGMPIALTYRHAPPIFPGAHAGDPLKALPMERTPVTPGAQYETIAAGGFSRVGAAVSRLRGTRSLGLDLDNPSAMHRPWLQAKPDASIDTDVVIVGGGIAGMTAAIAASKAKQKVTLIEAGGQLGGYARLFGSQDGQETPDQSITRLFEAIAQDHTITVMLGTEALALRPGVVRAHSVGITNGEVRARICDFVAPRVVLATGCVERLPIFPGNRQPGVGTSLESYGLAHAFGVWPGRSTLFATAGNIAYRLAMLASDAGISVTRILDARTDPQSRFVEFAKAYGITMAPGTIVGEVSTAAKGRGLSVAPQWALQQTLQPHAPLQADRVVLCGGWQPDLTLWHMAGGASRWNDATTRLEPESEGPKGVALAGSAAGYLSHHACLQSGKSAVAQLLGRRRITVEERLVDPIYETPDTAPSVAKQIARTAAPAFLDGGTSYIERPELGPTRWLDRLPFGKRKPAWSLADMAQPLALGDIAAGTQLGAIPAESAGIVAQERVALVAVKTPKAQPAETSPPETRAGLPAYLGGRFGDRSVIRSVAPQEPRRLQTGALIYADVDQSDPFRAIGVLMRGGDEGALALLASGSGSGTAAFVREDNRSFPIRILEQQVSQDLAPALGSSAGSP